MNPLEKQIIANRASILMELFNGLDSIIKGENQTEYQSEKDVLKAFAGFMLEEAAFLQSFLEGKPLEDLADRDTLIRFHDELNRRIADEE